MSGLNQDSVGSSGVSTAVTDTIKGVLGWPVTNVSAVAITPDGATAIGDQEHQYPLASVSKLVTAYAVLMATEEGAFELDDKVPAELLPGWDGDLPTVRDLLAHASGIAFGERTQDRPLRDRRSYSSAGFEVLAELIEHTTEISFADYVRLGICEPLDIDITVEGSAGHGFSASAGALSVLAAEFLHPKLLHENTMAAAVDVQFSTLDGIVPGYGRHSPCPWGLGFEIHGSKFPHWLGKDMPANVAGHFGQAGTFLWIHRDSGTAAVVLTDEPFGQWAKDRWDGFNTELWAAMGSPES